MKGHHRTISGASVRCGTGGRQGANFLSLRTDEFPGGEPSNPQGEPKTRLRRRTLTPLLQQPAVVLYAIASAVLVVSLYGLGFYTAKIRNDGRKIINAEDVKVNRGAVHVEVEPDAVARIKRAHSNAIENAVPFFVIGFLYTQTQPSAGMAMGLFGAFVLVRLLHAFFYLTATQPFRTMSFAVGGLINLAMVVQVLRAVL
jgi:glutathione S-transferase